MRSCLVGRWGEGSDLSPVLSLLNSWVAINWPMRRGVKISLLGGALLLFDFEDFLDFERVLLRGLRRFNEKVLHLERWSPEVGCFQKDG